jgi:hypothetical protein
VPHGVPEARTPRPDPWAAVRWSFLADRILGETWWLPQRVREHDRGIEVAYADALGLQTLDLEPLLRRQVERRPDDLWRLYFRMPFRGGFVTGHMTDAGNAWVADRIAEALEPAEP